MQLNFHLAAASAAGSQIMDSRMRAARLPCGGGGWGWGVLVWGGVVVNSSSGDPGDEASRGRSRRGGKILSEELSGGARPFTRGTHRSPARAGGGRGGRKQPSGPVETVGQMHDETIQTTRPPTVEAPRPGRWDAAALHNNIGPIRKVRNVPVYLKAADVSLKCKFKWIKI